MEWRRCFEAMTKKHPGLTIYASHRLVGRDVALLQQVAEELAAAALARGARAMELTIDCINGDVFARLTDDGAPAGDGSRFGARAALRGADGDLKVERSGPRGVAVVFYWRQLEAAGLLPGTQAA